MSEIGNNIFSNSSNPREFGFVYNTLNIPTINASAVNAASISTDSVSPYLTANVAIANSLLNASVGGTALGVANGLATLDALATVPLAQLPPGLSSALTKAPARVRTAPFPELPAYTAAGAGVGKTLTGAAFGSINTVGIDGVTTLAVANRVLVDQGANVAAVDRGVYTITALGTAGSPWVLTRALDFDENADVVYGTNLYVTEGNNSNGEGYSVSTPDPIVVDLSPLSFAKFTSSTPGYTLNADGIGTLLFDVSPANVTLFSFLFPGTPEFRAPGTIRFAFNVSANAALAAVNWRLFNSTAGAVVASGSIPGTTAYVNDTIVAASLLGTSWPATPAVFELQAVFSPTGATGACTFAVRSLQLF